jgi:hypothetical protein
MFDVDENGLRSCLMEGFSINGVESFGSATTVSVDRCNRNLNN